MAWLLALLVGLLGGERAGEGPCSDGGWGSIPGGEVVHVRADGDDRNVGTPEAPLRTLEEALERLRARDYDGRVIGVGPGVFPIAPVSMGEGDEGLTFTGCGSETILASLDDTRPVFSLTDGAAGTLAGVSLLGGSTGVQVTDGSFAYLSSVEIGDAAGPGIQVDEAYLQVDNVLVLPPTADASCGYGLAATGSWIRGESLTIVGAHELGVWVEDSRVRVDLLDVALTEPAVDGVLGRGLYSADSEVSITSGAFSANKDASLFFNDSWADLKGIVIDITGAGFVGDYSTGDGIVVVDSGSRAVRLSSSRIEGSARAALLLDGANVMAIDTELGEAGLEDELGMPVALQNGGVLFGDDPDLGGEPAEPLPYVDIAPDCSL